MDYSLVPYTSLSFAAFLIDWNKPLFQLNVVGTKRIKGIHTCTMEDLQWCLDGNLKTTFMMTQACLPYLEESKGQIINMSSFSGSRPVSVGSIIEKRTNPQYWKIDINDFEYLQKLMLNPLTSNTQNVRVASLRMIWTRADIYEIWRLHIKTI